MSVEREGWEPLMVPSMDTIRQHIADAGPHDAWPRRRDWGSGEVFAVVQRRWRRAIREDCTHPYGFSTSLATNVLGERSIECPRCYATAPAAAGGAPGPEGETT